MKKLKYIVQTGTQRALVDKAILELNQIQNITAESSIPGNISTIITIWYPESYTDLEIFELGISTGIILYPLYNL